MLNDTIGSLVMKKNNECFDDTLPPQSAIRTTGTGLLNLAQNCTHTSSSKTVFSPVSLILARTFSSVSQFVFWPLQSFWLPLVVPENIVTMFRDQTTTSENKII